MNLGSISTALALAALALAAWSDWRHGKIYNRLVVRTLAVALGWQVLVGALVLSGAPWAHVESLPLYYGSLALNAGIGLAVAVGMWSEHVWAAGDAKIFSAILVLLPLEAYGSPRVPLFPAITFLLNIFLALFVVLIAEWAVRRVRRRLTHAPPPPPTPGDKPLQERAKEMGLALLAFFFTLILIRVLRRLAREELQELLAMADNLALLLVFLATHWVTRLMRRKWVLAGMITLTIAVLGHELATTGRIAQWQSLVTLNLLGLALLAIRFFYIQEARVMEEVLIDPAELRANMILSWRQEKRQQEDKRFNENVFGKVGIEGISPEQVAALKDFYGPLGEKVGVVRTLPFAPLLLAGLVITLVAGGLAIRGSLG